MRKQKSRRESKGEKTCGSNPYVQKATAEGIEFIKQAGADDAVLTLKSLEAFAKAADEEQPRLSFRPNYRESLV